MKSTFSSFLLFLKSNWKDILLTALIIASASALLLLQPDVIKNSANVHEASSIEKINAPDAPWYRAINAPYVIAAASVNKFMDNALFSGRIVSGLFILLGTVLFYMLIKIWFNGRIALIGAILLLTNSITLNIAHQATTWSSLFLAPVAIYFTFNLLIRAKDYIFLKFLLFLGVLAISLYIPYMLWLVLIVGIAFIVYGKKKIKQLNIWQILAGVLLFGLIITPLIISLIGAPGQAKEMLGIPAELLTVKDYFINLIRLKLSFFIFAPTRPLIFLGNLPIMDIFTAAMIILGIYFFAKRIRHRRSIILFASAIILILVLALNVSFELHVGLLLPIFYTLAIVGLLEFMKQWFTFFPRNPLVRNLGVGLLVVAIGLVSFYQLQRYYVAWANSPETKSVYMIKY